MRVFHSPEANEFHPNTQQIDE